MPAWTGRRIAKAVLRKLQVLDPTQEPEPDELQTVLDASTLWLDALRTERLTLGATVRSIYSLATNTQSYTIGSGGTFNQDWPESIDQWGVIPDDDAASPVEIPMGRPLTMREWGAVRIKTQTGAHPTKLFFDDAWVAGLGTIKVHPIPDNADVDIVLYQKIPEITSLVAATTYNLRPGALRAIIYGLAVENADDFEKSDNMEDIKEKARTSLGMWKRSNIRPNQSGVRRDFAIGRHRRQGRMNIYNGA